MALGARSSLFFFPANNLTYPINVGRNIARESALTHFVFASDIELYPNDLYIYSSIVKPTIVLGEYRRLLRIISLPYGKKDQNITIEFPHLEYHDLSELQPSTLHFEIVSIDGRPVLPLNSDDIYLSLQFLHE